MRSIKNLIIGLLLGLLAGLWFGINIGRDRPLLSNPFEDRSLQKKVMRSGGEILEKSGRALQDKLESR